MGRYLDAVLPYNSGVDRFLRGLRTASGVDMRMLHRGFPQSSPVRFAKSARLVHLQNRRDVTPESPPASQRSQDRPRSTSLHTDRLGAAAAAFESSYFTKHYLHQNAETLLQTKIFFNTSS